MKNKYLNKDTNFYCQSGNNVRFVSQNCASNAKINGNGILTDKCILKLIGSPQVGQCPFTPDPSKNGAPPGPCARIIIGGIGWNNSSTLKISGQTALNSKCSINCHLGGIIKPCQTDFSKINVCDGADTVTISSSDKSDSSKKENIAAEKSSDQKKSYNTEYNGIQTNMSEKIIVSITKTENNKENNKYALCDISKCDKSEICPYLNTSCDLKETNESNNARILQTNIGINSDCEKIKSCNWNGFPCSVQYHHIIPVNQCFKKFMPLVKLANYYGYDINNRLNGICLPGMITGYNGRSEHEKTEIAFYVMDCLKMQWHKGPHSYSDPFEDLKGFPQKADSIFKNDRDKFKTYESSVNKYLQQYQNNLFRKKMCRMKNYDLQAKKFCEDMNYICKKIESKIRKFEKEPEQCTGFYVSKKALCYAYRDVLKDYIDEIFQE